MSALKLNVAIEKFPLAAPFRITGYVIEETGVVLVELVDGPYRGRGEAAGVYYLGDNVSTMVATIETHRKAIEAGIDRASLQQLLPPGGARNALDCALWELDAGRNQTPAWKLADLTSVQPLLTTMTLSANAPAVMAEGARKYAQARALKLKLTGELDLDVARIRAVRAARPDVWMGVDANQGYTIGALKSLLEELVHADIKLLEQPLARGHEADLDGFSSPIPIAADESALTLADVPGLVGRFQTVNIKLDKCGGLTEGLAMARKAHELGLGVMVGNMVGTSLAMAPAFVLGQLCDIVDLDGPIFLRRDRTPSVTYVDGKIHCGADIWGSGTTAPASGR